MNISNSIHNILRKKSQFPLINFTVLKVNGPDSDNFLNGQLTSNLKTLQSGSFQKSALTDVKGRIVSDFFLLKQSNEIFYMVVNTNLVKETLERINLFLISEDVEIESVDFKTFIHFNNPSNGFTGKAYNLDISLSFESFNELENISNEEFDLLKFFSGETEINKHAQIGDLINNTFLVESSVSFSKGCYPGQETISKIHNNRGAAYFPVCLIGNKQLDNGPLEIDSKKIGIIKESIIIDDLFFHYVDINRENRIENRLLKIIDHDFKISYFPLTNNSKEKIAEDLYDEAVAKFHINENDEAIDLLKKAIRINPSFSDAYESLGVIYGRLQRFEDAISIMKKLSEIDTTSVMAHTNLSMYYMQLGDKETAEEHKATATIKQFEQFGIVADKKRAEEDRLKNEQEDKSRREAMFIQVLEIDEEDALANFGLGELEFERENFEKSAEHLLKAIKGDSKYSVAYLALGKAYLKLNKKEESKHIFETGIEIASKKGDLMPANEMQIYLNKL
jgi:folate-binding protein YgfZ